MFQRVRSFFTRWCAHDGTRTDDVSQFIPGRIIKTFGEEKFQVLVLREVDGGFCDHCGEPFFLLALGLKNSKGGLVPILAMHESRFPLMMNVLHEVGLFLESPERKNLEVVKIT